jgi:pimeloyl-ACP methyl ester carboxylesterase
MVAQTQRPTLAHDDTGGRGRPVVMLPGAGDLRSEYRFVVDPLAAAGHRVVTADLPGHGDSPTATVYTVASTAAAIADLVRDLDGGPAVLVGTSFAPAAAVRVAADRPDLVAGIVAISPHLHADGSARGRLTTLAVAGLLRGPWAAAVWAKLYTGWYKAHPPADLPEEVGRLRAMLADPARRRAVRETLTADRDGMDAVIARADVPSLTVFGTADDHFPDPVAAARATAEELRGTHVLVDGAGHYPHVERPDTVATAILSFVEQLT